METKNAAFYTCNLCKFVSSKKSDYDRHILTAKHKWKQNVSNSCPSLFTCSVCSKNYKTRAGLFKHSVTKNHQKMETWKQMFPNEKNEYFCSCGKSYKSRSGLYKHSKICQESVTKNAEETSPIVTPQEVQITKSDMDKLVTEINEIKTENKQLIDLLTTQITNQGEQINEIIPMMGNGNTTINNNQTININTFLNIQCKNAQNFQHFVDNLYVSSEQLAYSLEHGLAKGIHKVIMDSMNRMKLEERPIHCTDIKREVVYVKNDVWSKDVEKKHVKKLIAAAGDEHLKAVNRWKDSNPDYITDMNKSVEFSLMTSNCVYVEAKTAKIASKTLCGSLYLNVKHLNRLKFK